MIIVNQNKSVTVNVDSISEIYTDIDNTGKKIYVKVNNEDTIFLGEYATKERALEVKWQIETAYINSELIKLPKIEIHEKLTSNDLAKCICFQMPEE